MKAAEERVHEILYSTESREELAKRIVRLQDLLSECIGWLDSSLEKGYVIPRFRYEEIDAEARKLGVEE